MIPWFEPVVVHLGVVRVHSFTLVLVAAITAAPVLGMVHAKLGGGRAWPLLALPFGVLVFAWPVGRAIYVLTTSPWLFVDDPMAVLRLHHGTSYPGFVAGLLPVCVFIGLAGRKWATVDGLAVAMAAAGSLVYFGRFLIHDHPGGMTQLPVGVRGICFGQWRNLHRACHDLGLYTSLGFLLFLGLAFALLLTAQRGWTAGLLALWTAAQHLGLEALFGGRAHLRPDLGLALPLLGLGVALFALRLVLRDPPPVDEGG